MNNNPVRYNDPTGHSISGPADEDGSDGKKLCSDSNANNTGQPLPCTYDAKKEKGGKTQNSPSLNGDDSCTTYSDGRYECTIVVNPDPTWISNYFSLARTLTRAGYFVVGILVGAIVALFIPGEVLIKALAGVVSALVMTGLLQTVVVPYELEVISAVQGEFQAAQNSGKLIIASPPDKSMNIVGNYIVDGNGDGVGTFVNTPAAAATVWVAAWLNGVSLP